MARKKKNHDFSVNALRVVREATGDTEYKTTPSNKNPAAVALGRLGGLKRNKQLTPEQRRELAKKAARARWSKESI
jgi:hypothetical protein